MEQAAHALAIAHLQSTRDAFQAALTGITDAQAQFKPAPDRWNMLEIAEHVAVAEHGMYRYISKLHEISDDAHTAESAATLARTADRKAMPLPAPERALPKNRFASLGEALSKFLENRERTIEYVRNCPADLRLRIIQHPAGILNAEDCVALMANHAARHVEQINELKAATGYPNWHPSQARSNER